MAVHWRGVFPAATTQFHPDQSLDLPATLAHLDAHDRGRRPRPDHARARWARTARWSTARSSRC